MQDSSTGTSKTFRANLVLQKVVHIMKGNFGLSAKKLQYETLQDQVYTVDEKDYSIDTNFRMMKLQENCPTQIKFLT